MYNQDNRKRTHLDYDDSGNHVEIQFPSLSLDFSLAGIGIGIDIGHFLLLCSLFRLSFR